MPADQKAGPMGEIAARELARLACRRVDGEHSDETTVCLGCLIDQLTAAYAAGREKGLEEAAEACSGIDTGDAGDYDGDRELDGAAKCRARIRALAAQPPPTLAQPSATRKEE